MAANISGIFDEITSNKIKESKLLVVGAGGIGCELLKCLVLTGFENITVVDLDTIELSNLNRQFLFHKEHIARSKAEVAKESILKFNPKANIVAHHESIHSPKFDYLFFKQFTLVLDALDNIGARSHVNRMCMNAKVPLIESGSAGYKGQVNVYKKGLTECFECLPRKGQRTYPSCTIRNTPSEPVHCIVWAKHLFSQLFGETDADNDVSPDMTDQENDSERKPENDQTNRVSTKEWAKTHDYNPETIFNKLFKEDIVYLNSMNHLWETRTRPRNLEWSLHKDSNSETNMEELQGEQREHTVWSLKQCQKIFSSSLASLKKRSEESNTFLIWDKDDNIAVDFVAACSNLRSNCFHIEQKSRFDVKAIAGNIIPAIASTNDAISGLIVLQAIRALKDLTKCRNTWLNENPAAEKLISSSQLEKPNPNCFVCSDKTPEIIVYINFTTFTVRSLGDKIIKQRLHMVAPEVTRTDTASILISSDPEDMDDQITDRTLGQMTSEHAVSLHCTDDLQQCAIKLNLLPCPDLKDQEFRFETDPDESRSQEENKNSHNIEKKELSTTEDNSTKMESLDDEDDILITGGVSTETITMDDDQKESSIAAAILKKVKHVADEDILPPAKKVKTTE